MTTQIDDFMAKETSLKLVEIESYMINNRRWDGLDINIRKDIVVPNVSWGFFNHELDLCIIKNGYVTEVEIKRSWSDFLADFKKDHSHSDPKISYFYYLVPFSIKERVVKYIEDNSIVADGVYSYQEDGTVIRCCERFSNIQNYKLSEVEQLKIAHLGCMRIWSLKNKLIKKRLVP